MASYIVEIFHGEPVRDGLPHLPFSEFENAESPELALLRALRRCVLERRIAPGFARVYAAVNSQRHGQSLMDWPEFGAPLLADLGRNGDVEQA